MTTNTMTLLSSVYGPIPEPLRTFENNHLLQSIGRQISGLLDKTVLITSNIKKITLKFKSFIDGINQTQGYTRKPIIKS